MNYPVTGATHLATYANKRIEFEGNATMYEVCCVKDVTEPPYGTTTATHASCSTRTTTSKRPSRPARREYSRSRTRLGEKLNLTLRAAEF
jgi:hypothetical protein